MSDHGHRPSTDTQRSSAKASDFSTENPPATISEVIFDSASVPKHLPFPTLTVGHGAVCERFEVLVASNESGRPVHGDHNTINNVLLHCVMHLAESFYKPGQDNMQGGIAQNK